VNNSAKCKKWRISHPEEYKASMRKAYEVWISKPGNREKSREKNKAGYQNNRNSRIEYQRNWYDKNKDIAIASCHLRRTRKIQNGGSYSRQDIADILISQGGKCAYFLHCGAVLNSKNREIDHIIPVSMGGSSNRQNIQILCRSCNRQKRAKDPIDHCRSIGWLL